MESQFLNCLFANLMGLGKQFLPQGQTGASSEGPTGAFFDILSQKMGGTANLLLSSMPAGIEGDDGKAEGGKPEDASACPVAASLDPEEIPVLVSSLISALEQPVVADSAAEMTEADRDAVMDFLEGILEVLSDGDEVEVTRSQGAGPEPVECVEKDQEKGIQDVKDVMACLASILARLGGEEAEGLGPDESVPARQPIVSGQETDPAGKVEKRPAPVAMKAEVPQPAAQATLPEEQETPEFVVEIVKAAKNAPAADPSMKKEMQSQPATPAAETPEAGEKDVAVLAARAPEGREDAEEPGKIVIRVRETSETQIGEDKTGGDNPAIQHDDPSRQAHREAASEVKGAVKNDFGAMMVDKIEKLTEQFAGRNMNMDMTVKLRIDDNETVLVGLRDEGSSVTVEVKTTNESTMNFLQSQKENIGRALEMRNIQTTIHVDIDQDTQGRRQHRQNKDSGEGETPQQQDFDSFFEALA